MIFASPKNLSPAYHRPKAGACSWTGRVENLGISAQTFGADDNRNLTV